MAATKEITERSFTEFEIVFINTYLTCYDKTQSYLAIPGTSNTKFPSQAGFDIYNRPHVKAYITECLKLAIPEPSAISKLINDMATANISDYMATREVPKEVRKEVSLKRLINQEKENIWIQEDISQRPDATEEDVEEYLEYKRLATKRLYALQAELKRNPLATRFVWVVEMVEEEYLDLKALKKDKARGRIKTFQVDKFGAVKVELYSAADMAKEAAKLNGQYELDNGQKAAANHIDMTKLDPNIMAAIIKANKKPKPQ